MTATKRSRAAWVLTKTRAATLSAALPASPIIVNGWAIFAHPLFLDQVERLIKKIEDGRSTNRHKSQAVAANTPNEKLLAAILDSAFARIPRDPSDPQFRQGGTLGSDARHWFRDKFFNGRFRLFFRFQSRAKTIVLVWVNDETTLRAYESSSDAYAVFRNMLAAGKPPDKWDDLLCEASKLEPLKRVEKLLERTKK